MPIDRLVCVMTLLETDDWEGVTVPSFSLPVPSVILYVSVDADKFPKQSLHELRSIFQASEIEQKLIFTTCVAKITICSDLNYSPAVYNNRKKSRQL